MKTIKNHNQSGFTIIEIIVVLVIMGVLAVGLSIGLIKSVEQYIFASEATQLSQKAQLAMARIKKELTDATAVSSISGNRIVYTRPYSPPSCQQATGCQYSIQQLNDQIFLGGTGVADRQRVLINNVAAYAGGNVFLTFKDFNDADWIVETGNTLNNLAKIEVLIILTYGANQTLTFNTTINPRQSTRLNAPKLN